MRVLLASTEDCCIGKVFRNMTEYYVCDIVSKSDEYMYFADCNEYDVFVLTDHVKDIEPLDLCRWLRTNGHKIPIAYLSSCPSSEEKVRFLQSGMDVYLPLGTNMEEFYAELMVHFRRYCSSTLDESVSFKGFTLCLNRHLLFRDKETIFLRKKEYSLLEYLCLNIGKVLSKEQVLEHVWEDGINVSSNTLEVHIRNLRKRFRNYTGECVIETRKGIGYLLTA